MSTFPQVANIAGLQGLLVYALSCGLPMLLFSFFGPKLRRQCPDGFVLTEWVFQRYGKITGLYLSACTILTLFLFMVSEIASVQYALTSLTGMNVVPAVIIQCVVTSIYTSVGGFKISFITDTLQASVVIGLIIVMSAAVGAYVEIDTSQIGPSGLLNSSKLGWQLVYILPVAIFTNDLFVSGFWLRTFASRSDKDLWIGCSIAVFLITSFAVIIGVSGLIAVWGGYVEIGDESSSASLFIILADLPNWVVGFALVFVIIISTCTLDSLQSALTSTISNDIFRNKLSVIYCRIIVVIIVVPVVVVGLKVADDVLQIYFIADLLSAAVIPIIMIGLSSKFYFLTGYEVVSGGFGGLLTVFIFGVIYYGDAREGAKLLLIWNGIYGNDWSAFGAFVAAPVGGLLSSTIMLGIRLSVLKIYSIVKGVPFTALDKIALSEESDTSSKSSVVIDVESTDPSTKLSTKL
jgi:Na+/proline symporter